MSMKFLWKYFMMLFLISNSHYFDNLNIAVGRRATCCDGKTALEGESTDLGAYLLGFPWGSQENPQDLSWPQFIFIFIYL